MVRREMQIRVTVHCLIADFVSLMEQCHGECEDRRQVDPSLDPTVLVVLRNGDNLLHRIDDTIHILGGPFQQQRSSTGEALERHHIIFFNDRRGVERRRRQWCDVLLILRLMGRRTVLSEEILVTHCSCPSCVSDACIAFFFSSSRRILSVAVVEISFNRSGGMMTSTGTGCLLESLK